MDVNVLSDKLQNKPDLIYKIIDSLGFTNIKYSNSNNNFRFSRAYGHNPTGCVLDCETLKYFIFSTGQKGNLFSLIMDVEACSFPDSLKYAAKIAGISNEELNIKVRYPFGGFYLKLVPSPKDSSSIIETYPEDILKKYSGMFNMRFFNDGISFISQQKFGVGYDVETNRITIPERNLDGSLIGIMGRANYECDHKDRWYPIISCARSKVLYGYSYNYKKIQEHNTVILFESEKAVMQCDSFGLNVALATSGCYISDTQAEQIKRLYPKKIIVAYDEGLRESDIVEECKKLVSDNMILKTKVGYIWDEASLIPEGSKMNIADLGKRGCSEGINKYVRWIN